MSELRVRGLRKSFAGIPVLRGVDLVVPQGTLVAVLGPSGCGKTTLLRVVAGFEPPDGGEVALGGRVVAAPGGSIPPERRRIGVVPQEGALFPHLTVAGNVGFGLSRRSARSGRVDEMLDLVGLAGYGDRMPAELSGGQQQRVALARALAPEPALVLLDEPFSALDTGLRAALREDVRAALLATGATAVLVTHDQQEALSIADLVAVMRDGRVVQAAAPAEVYGAPADLGVATFVGEAVVLPAVLHGGWADTVLGPLPVRESAAGRPPAEGDNGQVVIRPEQIVLTPARTSVGARVRGATFFGHDALVELDLVPERQPPVRVQARTQALALPPYDAAVAIAVTGGVCFFPSGASSLESSR